MEAGGTEVSGASRDLINQERKIMRVYITGIAGMLGSSLAKALRGTYEVFGSDLIPVSIFGCSCQQMDLLNENSLKNHIVEVKPDVLIHTVAMVNVDLCEMQPNQARLLNSELTGRVAKLCKEYCIKMVYISTDAVFDGEMKGLYAETDKIHPLNVYGKTKADGESRTLHLDNGLVLRTNIYGMNIQNKKSFGEWIVCALKNGETLNMFTDVLFSPILTTDFSEIVCLSIKNDLRGIYHVCATGSVSKYEFGIAVKDIFNIKSGHILPCISSSMGFAALRSKNMGMSNQKICRELHISIREPIESIYEFLRINMAVIKQKGGN